MERNSMKIEHNKSDKNNSEIIKIIFSKQEIVSRDIITHKKLEELGNIKKIDDLIYGLMIISVGMKRGGE